MSAVTTRSCPLVFDANATTPSKAREVVCLIQDEDVNISMRTSSEAYRGTDLNLTLTNRS
jgi:hypothetical protein